MMKAVSFWTKLFMPLAFMGLAALAAAQENQPKERLVLDYGNPTSANQARDILDSIQAGTGKADAISVIEVKGYSIFANVAQLTQVLRLLSSPLAELHYALDTPVTHGLVQVLKQHHEEARLYYQIPFETNDPDREDIFYDHEMRPSDEPTPEMQREILGSSNLYSLKAEISYGSFDNYRHLPLVYEILTNCPGLRELDLELRYDGGCVSGRFPWAFDFTKDNKLFSPLEVLKLTGYRPYTFSNGERLRLAPHLRWPPNWPDFFLDLLIGRWNGLQLGIEYNEIAKEPHNLRVWLQRMDWSKLKHLALDEIDTTILEDISLALNALERLEVSYGSSCTAKAFPTFLRNLTQPLKQLSMTNLMFDDYDELLSILSSFGDGLEALTLVESEHARMRYCHTEGRPIDICPTNRGQYYLDRPFLNASQITGVSASNPNITRIAFDIPRIVPVLEDNSTWTIDYEAIRAAATMPKLRQLQLNLESPDFPIVRSGRRSERTGTTIRYSEYDSMWNNLFAHDPSFNRTSVPALFQELNLQRAKAGLSPIRKMVIKVGRWEGLQSDWGMGGPPNLLVGYWTCIVDDEGEQSCSGGNDHLGYRWGRQSKLQDPYSEDWSLPDEPEYQYDEEEQLLMGDIDFL